MLDVNGLILPQRVYIHRLDLFANIQTQEIMLALMYKCQLE